MLSYVCFKLQPSSILKLIVVWLQVPVNRIIGAAPRQRILVTVSLVPSGWHSNQLKAQGQHYGSYHEAQSE